MSSSELKQRLAAILAADVAGYSRLMATDERATVAALDAARATDRKIYPRPLAEVLPFRLLSPRASAPNGTYVVSRFAICIWYYLGMTLVPVLAGWLRDWTGSAKAPVLLAGLLMASVVVCVVLLRTLQAKWLIGEQATRVSPAQ